MLQGWIVVGTSFAYLGLLFAIAYYADKRADQGRSVIASPYIYALSLAVYATAWTFYGSVGRAAMRVVVMGAGLAGVTTAWALAGDGHEVIVVERESQVAAGASAANGGIIAPSRAFPWPGPHMLATLARALLSSDEGVSVRWRIDPELWLWAPRFLANCSRARYLRILQAKLRLARYSQEKLHQLVAETRIGYRRLSEGALYLFRSEAALEHAWQRAMPMRQAGIAMEQLDAAGTRRREPALEGARAPLGGAIYAPGDEAGDAALFCRELALQCRRAGVVFLHDCDIVALDALDVTVKELVTRKGRVRGDAFVCALGVMPMELRERLGAPLPVYPVKGYSATAPLRAPGAGPARPGIDEARRVTFCPLDGELRITGGAEFAGYDRAQRARDFERLYAVIDELFPGAVDFARARTTACLRPMTPESTPRFGTARHANLWFNAGHGHMGFATAAGAARIVADLVAGREPEIDLEGLRVRRA